MDKGKNFTYRVRLEYGPQPGECNYYDVRAKNDSDAIKKAIIKHRKSWPYHSEAMLRINAYIENPINFSK